MVQVREEVILKGRRFLSFYHNNPELLPDEYFRISGEKFVVEVYTDWSILFTSVMVKPSLRQSFAEALMKGRFKKDEVITLDEYDELVNDYKVSFDKSEEDYMLYYSYLLAGLVTICGSCLEVYMGDDTNDN
jgi:hypothetical protein